MIKPLLCSATLQLGSVERFQEHLPIRDQFQSTPFPTANLRFSYFPCADDELQIYIAYNQKLGGSCGAKHAEALVRMFISLPCRSSLPSYHPCCSSICKHHTVPYNTTTIKHAETQSILRKSANNSTQLPTDEQITESLGVQSLNVSPVSCLCSSSDYNCSHMLCNYYY